MTEQLREIFWQAFGEFVESEADNILNGTSEQNLCGRRAPAIERLAHDEGFDQYRADVEYNRKQRGAVKTILDDQGYIVRIRPDIILHSRGQLVEGDNLIAIEMKRMGHPSTEKDKDRVRLRALTKASY